MKRNQQVNNNGNQSLAHDLFSSFKAIVNDLTGTTTNENNQINTTKAIIHNNSHQKVNDHPTTSTRRKIPHTYTDDVTPTGKLFPQSVECLERKLTGEVEKVKRVLDHSQVTLFQLESGDEALDDLICLLSDQLKIASEMKRDNHEKLLRKLKNQGIQQKPIIPSEKKTKEITNERILKLPIGMENNNPQMEISGMSAMVNTTPITHNVWDLLDTSNMIESSLEYDSRCDKWGSNFVELPSDILIHVGSFLFAKDLINLGQSNAKLLKLFFNQTVFRARALYQMKYSFQFDENMNTNDVSSKNQIEEYRKDEDDSFSQVQHFIWKPLCILLFPRMNKALNITNWMHTLRRRVMHVKLYEPHKLPLTLVQSSSSFDSLSIKLPTIENCEWIYKCPINFDELPMTFSDVKHCNVCNKDVYLTYNEKDFVDHAKLGHCVAIKPRLNFGISMISGGMPAVFTHPPTFGQFNL